MNPYLHVYHVIEYLKSHSMYSTYRSYVCTSLYVLASVLRDNKYNACNCDV
jgi:hypothetical protein